MNEGNARSIAPITELTTGHNTQRTEYYQLPNARVIGKAIRCTLDENAPNPIPAFWGQCDSEGLFETLKTPSRLIPAMLGFTDAYDEKTNTFLYIVGALFPEGFAVPQSYVHRDIPATVVSKGPYGEWLDGCRPFWDADGFVWSGAEGQFWNAELYMDDEDPEGFRLLCAVMPK